MKQFSLLVPSAFLFAGAAFTIGSCSGSEEPGGGGGTSSGGGGSSASGKVGAPTDTGLPGLILGLSSNDVEGRPLPSTMVLLRPESAASDANWTEERIIPKAMTVTLATGTYADGSFAMGELGADGTPKGPVQFVKNDGAWTVEPAEGEVTWDTRTDEDTGETSYVTKGYELEGGNVFHKGMWFEPAFGEPGILTVAANMPFLCIWHRKGNSWEPTVLWSDLVGGKEQRFRDVEVGDIDGDGQDELVVVTHDFGGIYVLEQTADGMVPTKIHEWTDQRIFAHEVEIGDIDGDGKPEFFTTPSTPNKADKSLPQPGWVDMYRHNAETGEYERFNMGWERRHAKEILVTDYDGDGVCELYCAIEAKGTDDKVNEIHRYIWKDGGLVEDKIIELDGRACRFLVLADTNGDGVNELIASTGKAGIFRVHLDDAGEWQVKKIVPSYMSSGFEHATYALDMDGDGKDELYVGSDDQKIVNIFRMNETTGGYRPTKLANWGDEGFYLIWNITTLPAGK